MVEKMFATSVIVGLAEEITDDSYLFIFQKSKGVKGQKIKRRRQQKHQPVSKQVKKAAPTKYYKTGVINDPLGQTYSLASSEHCFHFVLFDF